MTYRASGVLTLAQCGEALPDKFTCLDYHATI